MPTAPGTHVGPYEILALLGAGGMGEVYKAIDTRLGRTVAVKILKSEHTDRLDREARAIASLNHPHICTIHDIGPNYLVMEYLEGAPLSSPVPVADALRYAGQIADALEAAHAKGVIHRDLKPGNIFVTASGVKLLDFGLAKLTGESNSTDETMSMTQEGTILGTAPYMSPEQAQAKEIDARSDIFSFGLVLYEMVSGQRAFAANSVIGMMAAIVRDEPRPLRTAPEIERVVARCLRKSPADRFQSMAEVRAALSGGASAQPPTQQPSIAVLPFSNMSADKENEYFSDGLAEEILNALGHIPGLKVTARTSSFNLRGKDLDARKIAEILNVQNVLEGSVRRSGNRIRVSVQLVNATDGYHLWSERYDRELTDVFAVQDEIAAAVAKALRVKLAGVAPVPRHTPNLPAYEAFLKGRHYGFKNTPEDFARAQTFLHQAIALDPEYAEPHSFLAAQYFLLWSNGIKPANEIVPLIRAEAQKSLDLSDLSGHCMLAAVAAAYDYDWKEATKQFRLAGSALLETPTPHYAFYLIPLDRHREALELLERAVESDPLNLVYRMLLGLTLLQADMPDQGIREAMKALEIDERAWLPYVPLVFGYYMQGRIPEALAAAEKGYQCAPWHPRMTGQLAGLLSRTGNTDRAEALIRPMQADPNRSCAPTGMILYHLIRSEIDAAADWYEKAIEQRDPIAIPWITNPLCAPLRASPRWAKIAKMMNLQEMYREAGETP